MQETTVVPTRASDEPLLRIVGDPLVPVPQRIRAVVALLDLSQGGTLQLPALLSQGLALAATRTLASAPATR